MGTRRRGRECALQVLYQLEASADPGPPEAIGEELVQRGPLLRDTSLERADTALAMFLDNFEAPDKARKFTERIVRGVIGRVDEINTLVQKHSPRWRLERMAMVDRNVLRISAWELLEDREVDTPVIIDEAVEIARRFGSERSAAFVNGVLDALAGEIRSGAKGATSTGATSTEGGS